MTDEDLTIRAMRRAFQMTKQRCYNPACPDYPHYGGRGIRICEEWLTSFQAFVDDMGVRPDGFTLDRIDVDKDYGPLNCVWVDRKTQTRNRRMTVTLTWQGETKSLAEWSEITGIPYDTLKARKQRLGYTDEQCLTRPVHSGVPIPGRERKYVPGTMPSGLDSPMTVFTKEMLKVIAERVKQGHVKAQIARDLKISPGSINNGLKLYAAQLEAEKLQNSH